MFGVIVATAATAAVAAQIENEAFEKQISELTTAEKISLRKQRHARLQEDARNARLAREENHTSWWPAFIVGLIFGSFGK